MSDSYAFGPSSKDDNITYLSVVDLVSRLKSKSILNFLFMPAAPTFYCSITHPLSPSLLLQEVLFQLCQHFTTAIHMNFFNFITNADICLPPYFNLSQSKNFQICVSICFMFAQPRLSLLPLN